MPLAPNPKVPIVQKNSLVFCRFSSLHRKISKLKGKGHEPSQAENSLARDTARASSVGAHHYLLDPTNATVSLDLELHMKSKPLFKTSLYFVCITF